MSLERIAGWRWVQVEFKTSKKQQHSLLFELENDKEILADNYVERAVLTPVLNSSPTPHDGAVTEVQAAGVSELPPPALQETRGSHMACFNVH